MKMVGLLQDEIDKLRRQLELEVEKRKVAEQCSVSSSIGEMLLEAIAQSAAKREREACAALALELACGACACGSPHDHADVEGRSSDIAEAILARGKPK